MKKWTGKYTSKYACLACLFVHYKRRNVPYIVYRGGLVAHTLCTKLNFNRKQRFHQLHVVHHFEGRSLRSSQFRSRMTSAYWPTEIWPVSIFQYTLTIPRQFDKLKYSTFDQRVNASSRGTVLQVRFPFDSLTR